MSFQTLNFVKRQPKPESWNRNGLPMGDNVSRFYGNAQKQQLCFLLVNSEVT
jgi:hypothetical protein